MAKGKPKGGKRPGAGRKAKPVREQQATLLVRGSQEWRRFVDKLAEHDRASSLAEVVDRALEAYAKAVGYPGEVPRR